MPIIPRDREPVEPEVEKRPETEIEEITTPEKEKVPEKTAKTSILEEEAQKPSPPPKPAPEIPSPAATKTQTLEAIEKILSEDLKDIYTQLPENKKKEFKRKGEETAAKIESILQKAKFKIKELLGLIKDWLKIIPGVNRFFLEQESKIKTDKILKLKK